MLARLGLLALSGFIAYGSMLPAPFRVMDDRLSIVENPLVKSADARSAFREGYFHGKSYYRPLVNLTYIAEYRLFGLQAFFYNLDNLLLHIINACLVVVLVSMLANPSVGFWTGLLFVLHPVQWEAVCNVPGRAILLSGFFELVTFVLWLKWHRSRRWFYGPLILASFFAALLCKESAGVFPLVTLAYLGLDRESPWRRKVELLFPLIAAMAGYLLLRRHFGIIEVHHSNRPLLYFVTFLRSVLTDLRLFVWPVDLHLDRCRQLLVSFHQPEARATCLFWAAAGTAFIFSARRMAPFAVFLVAWFWIELLPVAQLAAVIPVGANGISTAEHFLYLASIPVFVGMVAAFQRVYQKGRINQGPLKFAAGGFLAFLLLTAVEQSIYASNESNMLQRSLRFEPANPRVQSAMAMISIFRGGVSEAEKHFRAAVASDPLVAKYHIGLGTVLSQQGKYIEGLEQLVALDPGQDKALALRQEQLTMEQIRRQLAAGKTFDSRGWLAIGIYDAQTGQNQGAIKAFLKTVSLNPSQPDAWFNLASIDEAGQDWPHARSSYQKLLSLPGATAFQRDFASKHLAAMDNK